MVKSVTWVTNAEGQLAFVDEKSGVEIVNPLVSTCGRFDVDPTEAYDIDEANAVRLAQRNGFLEVVDLD